MHKNTIHMREHTASRLDIKSREGEDSRTIHGYAIVFGTRSAPLWSDDYSEGYEVISREAVSQQLLDSSDIRFTMFHNPQALLARSNKGAGSLKYGIDETGVWFEFDAPKTTWGDYALESVRRGDISGCSFKFSTYYNDPQFVKSRETKETGKRIYTHEVKRIVSIYDMTLAACPAYPTTSVSSRELFTPTSPITTPEAPSATCNRELLKQMRETAKKKIY